MEPGSAPATTPRTATLVLSTIPASRPSGVRGENHLAVAGDYFGRTTPRDETDDAKRPVGARGDAKAPAFSAFVWLTSDVVMALIGAGRLSHQLRVRSCSRADAMET
jgi:hypothetical protein